MVVQFYINGFGQDAMVAFTAYLKWWQLYVFAYFGIWSGDDLLLVKNIERTIKACQKGGKNRPLC